MILVQPENIAIYKVEHDQSASIESDNSQKAGRFSPELFLQEIRQNTQLTQFKNRENFTIAFSDIGESNISREFQIANKIPQEAEHGKLPHLGIDVDKRYKTAWRQVSSLGKVENKTRENPSYSINERESPLEEPTSFSVHKCDDIWSNIHSLHDLDAHSIKMSLAASQNLLGLKLADTTHENMNSIVNVNLKAVLPYDENVVARVQNEEWRKMESQDDGRSVPYSNLDTEYNLAKSATKKIESFSELSKNNIEQERITITPDGTIFVNQALDDKVLSEFIHNNKSVSNFDAFTQRKKLTNKNMEFSHSSSSRMLLDEDTAPQPYSNSNVSDLRSALWRTPVTQVNSDLVGLLVKNIEVQSTRLNDADRSDVRSLVTIEYSGEKIDIKFASSNREVADLLSRHQQDLKTTFKSLGIESYEFSFACDYAKSEQRQRAPQTENEILDLEPQFSLEILYDMVPRSGIDKRI